jgi:hypothetical protein
VQETAVYVNMAGEESAARESGEQAVYVSMAGRKNQCKECGEISIVSIAGRRVGSWESRRTKMVSHEHKQGEE